MVRSAGVQTRNRGYRHYNVRERMIFWSALKADFRPDSDLDFLVEFQPNAHIGLVRFVQMAQELEAARHRKVT